MPLSYGRLMNLFFRIPGCVFLGLCISLVACHAQNESDQKEALVEGNEKKTTLRLVTYNVACGQWATP